MPTRAKFYVFTIVAAGGFTLACAAALWSCQSPTRFLACLGLALLGSMFKVKIPAMESCISPNFIPLLFSVATMSWQEATAMAAACGIVQTLWAPKLQPQLIQVVFNGANLALAIGAAIAISRALAPVQIVVQLAVAVIVFELMNTLMVSIVVCLISGSALGSIWRNCHLWTFPYHLGGALLAAVWVQTEGAASLSIAFMAAATLYLMNTFYQELVRRLTIVEARS